MFVGSLLVIIICYLGAVLPIWSMGAADQTISPSGIVMAGIIGGVIGL